MTSLADSRVHDITSARIGRVLVRYRFVIHLGLLIFAVLLASADRHHAAVTGAATQASMVPVPPPAAEQPPVDDRPLALPDR